MLIHPPQALANGKIKKNNVLSSCLRSWSCGSELRGRRPGCGLATERMKLNKNIALDKAVIGGASTTLVFDATTSG